MIQRLNSKNLLTSKKGLKMGLAQLADQIKTTLKKVLEVGIKLFKNTFQYKCLCILTLPKCNA